MAIQQHTLGTQTIEIYKGEDKTFLISVFDGNRDPLDLASCTLTVNVQPELCDDVITMTKSSDDVAEVEIRAPTTLGQAYLHFITSDTEDLDHGAYTYDVWIELASGDDRIVIVPSLFNIKQGLLIGTV